MRRIAKAVAVSVPLLFAVACSDECKGPDDCAPGELCIRPVGADNERGASQCVPANNANLTCTVDADCAPMSTLFVCVAQRCVLRGTGTTTTAQDSGVVPDAMVTPVDGGATDGGPDAGPPPTPCEAYCTNVLANCNVGANRLYNSQQECLTTCTRFPSIGTATVSGNSVECRTYHAGAPAAGDPNTHCIHAAPSGGGVCGSVCDAYCDQVMGNCTGANAQYPNRAACVASCAAFPVVNVATATVSGNSAECRIYHASFPAFGDPATHCAHGGTGGGDVCGSRCDAYCDQSTRNCGTLLYSDRTACMLACPTFSSTTTENATGGNSVQCRTYHASFPSAADSAVHCPHAGIAGGDVCGSYCEVYCDFLDQNCAAPNNQYMDRAACLAQCPGIPSTGTASATQGNSIQCRSYHASFPADADPGTHCPHAGLAGGGVCGP